MICAEQRICSDIGTFKHFNVISMTTCAEECYRRRRCKVFMFHNVMNNCELKDDIDIDSLEQREPFCSYYTIKDWPICDIGRCIERPCDLTERCESVTSKIFQCVKSECPRPTEIDNAKVLSNTHSIGSINRYKCKGSLASKGNPKIKCLSNATWSVTDFKCLLDLPPQSKMPCPLLEKHYLNADLINIVGNGAAGTILTYRCRSGYTKNDTQTVQVTCQQSGLWDSDYIRCCHVNSTHYLENGCVAFVEIIFNTYTVAEDYCLSINGILSSPMEDQSIYFSESTYVLLHQKKSWVAGNWKYDECARDNGVTVDPDLTFRQKVDEVRYGGLTGKHCWWGHQWVSSEPQEDKEDCMLRDRFEKFKIHDYECHYLPRRHPIGFVCGFNTLKINP
ncbi:C4b-binding protein alpha [Mactra antiquata]